MKKIVIGLTGPTGCGKTSASIFLKNFGFEVIIADEIVKFLYLNCKSLIEAVRLNFDGIVNYGIVNRRRLAEIVFNDETERLKLEKIIWPFVIKILKNKICESSSLKIVIDAPTLFESGAFKFCDFSISVLSNRKKRLSRIVKRDGLTKELAMCRINSQKPDSFYIANSDGLVVNDGVEEDMFNSILVLIDKIIKSKSL